MRPPGCLPWFGLRRRRLLLPLPSIRSTPSIPISRPILTTGVVPTALRSRQHLTRHPPQDLESQVRPLAGFTAKARAQYPLPMCRLSRSTQDTPNIRTTLNTRSAPTSLLHRERPIHNLEDPQQP